MKVGHDVYYTQNDKIKVKGLGIDDGTRCDIWCSGGRHFQWKHHDRTHGAYDGKLGAMC